MVRTDLLSSITFILIITVCYWGWIAFEIWLVSRDRRSENKSAVDRGAEILLFFGGA
jgi:hypothetical protein